AWIGRRVYAAACADRSISVGAGMGCVVVNQGRTHLGIRKYTEDGGRTSTEPGRPRVNGDIDVDRVGVQSLEIRGSEIECVPRRLGDEGIEVRIDRQRVGWATQRQRRHPREQR